MGSIQCRKSSNELSLQVNSDPPRVHVVIVILPLRTLAEEEPDVTSVALRPGMVDTNVSGLSQSLLFRLFYRNFRCNSV